MSASANPTAQSTGSPRRIAILGSTGSIGRSTLDVVRASGGRISVLALAAHRSCDALLAQAREFNPQIVVVSDPAVAQTFPRDQLPPGVDFLSGPEGLTRAATHPEVHTVVSAIVGSAGLQSTWEAVKRGKTIALANKETLVMAGPLVMELAAQTGALVLPVDSEHSAIFQALASGPRSAVERVVLTASGGPFRNYSQAQMEQVTIAEALKHPTWSMGPKITIDSATMMNKALEMIEARWLFGLEPGQIEVVVHPQSIIHSLVEYVDGSILAQLSPPDMRLPIQYALTWPERLPGPAKKLAWRSSHTLELLPPNEELFPALRLGREVAHQGGTAGAVLNAANEAAVARFLGGEMRYLEITAACRAVVAHHTFEQHPTLERLFQLDAWARQEILRWKAC